MIKKLKNALGLCFKTRSQLEYDYLSASNDLCDLERRQRQLERGEVRF